MYTFISDPGHGWLEVPSAELIKTGIALDISECSYRDPKTGNVYLEEDIDAPLFMAAAGVTDKDIRHKHHDAGCFVRKLPHID